MASNSATGIASQQSIKAYVDSQVTAQDLDFQADSGGALSIDLDSETLTFTGGTGIDTSGSGNAVTFAIDSTVTTLTGSQTLTNKTLTAPTLTGTAVVASLDISGDIDVDGTTNLDVVDIDGAVDMASTLQVDGAITSSAPLEISTSSGDALKVTTTTGRADLFLTDTDTTDGQVRLRGDANNLVFITNTTERMRIDSSGNVTVKASGADQARTLSLQGTNGASETYQFNLIADGENAAAKFMVGVGGGSATERMRIDSNGKLLVNTSTHTLTDTEMVVSSEYHASNTTTGGITLSARQGGGWRNSGIFANGSDLTFTTGDTGLNGAQSSSEKMRIDSSGNVGISTDSPRASLDLGAGSGDGTLSNTASEYQLILEANASTTGDIGRSIGWATGTSTVSAAINSYDAGTGVTNGLIFATAYNGSLAERMRIDSIGNVGIGTDSPDSPLEIQAATNSSSDTTYLKLFNAGENVGHIDFENGNGSLARITGTKEGSGASANDGLLTFSTALDASLSVALRIDSNGRLLVAQTSGVGIGGTPADVNGTEIGKGYINLNRDDTASANQIQFGKNGAVAGRITTTTTTSYVETSDRRVKSNIADAEDCGTAIDLMRVRKFDWTESGEHHPFGMIAQELLEIAPIAVDAPNDPSEMMGIDYSKLVPMLVKEIQSLRARVQQLENTNGYMDSIRNGS